MSNISNEKVLKILGWALIILSSLFFAGALCALAYSVFFAQCFYSDTVRLANVLVTTSAVSAVLGATLLVQSKNRADKNEQRSRDHLDAWVLAYKEASAALEDGNNILLNWARAAYLLRQAKTLEKNIKEESHVLALEVHRIKYRYIFSDVLDKPAIHFYGASRRFMEENKGLSKEALLNKAGEEAWKPKEMKDLYEEPYWDVNPIPEEALYAVRQAAQWPEDYRKLFKDWKFSEEDRQRLRFGVGGFSGLAKYLDHLDSIRSRKLGIKSRGEN